MFNVVHCGNEAASLLTSDPRVQAVSFVGSFRRRGTYYLPYHRQPMANAYYTFGAAKNHANRRFSMQIWTPPSTPLWAEHLVPRANALHGAAGSVACDETADRPIERLKPLDCGATYRPSESCAAKMKMKWPVVSRAHQQKVLGYIDKGA